ncbi:MAG: TlpA disulfide reductase family protein [Pseudomonadales bacterium]|jgi:thiol-disulfide isomerase/thioredoxin|nr:TlpA disulfide reductase family protein [Pseudomonadales bacterium]
MRAAERLGTCVLAAALLAACAEESGHLDEPLAAESDVAEAPAAPSVELLSGERRALAEFRGSWLFVNYWAEWCAPCLEEIPELNALHAEDGVYVLGINFDQLDAGTMRPQVAALGIRFPVAAVDPTELLGLELPEVLPSTFVFDPSGETVAVLRGPQTLDALHGAMTSMHAAPGASD